MSYDMPSRIRTSGGSMGGSMHQPAPFRFSTAGHIISGPPLPEGLAEILQVRRPKHVLFLCDPNVATLDGVQAAIQAAADGGRVTIRTDLHPEPTADQVTALQRDLTGRGFDLIVAIGGGSVIDVAKLLSVLIDAPRTVADVVGIDRIAAPGIPLVAIPTTAGTGAEVTPNAIVTLTDQRLKVGAVSRHLLPAHVILDPELTVGMPPLVTASTGVDAFIHSLESVTSNKSNAMCDAVGYHSMRLIYPALPRAFSDPRDLDARRDMLLGSMLGGMALTAAGTTAVHALSYPLGGRFGVPHGIANAMLLLPVMEFNRPALGAEFADIAVTLGIAPPDIEPEERADRFLDALRTLVRQVEIPTDLAAYGVSANDLDDLALAASGVTRLLGNNRRPVGLAEIRMMYERALNVR